MFTVLICGNALIKSIKTDHSHLFDLLMRNRNCALCGWNPEGMTLEEAVPDLERLIAGRTEWRAVLVLDSDTLGIECINKRNPFDAVGSMKILNDFNEQKVLDLLDEMGTVSERISDIENAEDREKYADELLKLNARQDELLAITESEIAISREKIQSFREQKRNNYTNAPKNPLTRLAVWLLGAPVKEKPEAPNTWPESVLGTPDIDMEYYKTLFSLNALPTDVEQFAALQFKFDTLKNFFLTDAVVDKKPSEILVLSERLSTRADDIFGQVKNTFEELEYDNFCDDNLYPAQMRFILSDVDYQNEKRTPIAYLTFATCIFLMATNDMPEAVLRPERVYNAHVKIDERKARHFFTQYLRKLDATKRLLQRRLASMEITRDADDLTRDEAIELFEKEVTVPVEVRVKESRVDFMASHDIGLSKDCPRDEYDYWYNQITDITKRFIRYLREPRRALKFAVKNSFRDKSVIKDERIFQLNEERLEDIEYKLEEEEQRMIETTTTQLFKTKEYTNRMEKADRVIRNGIAKRMTKKRVLCSALIAIGAFLFGFLPLIIGNIRNAKTLMTTFAIIGISVGLLAFIGLMFLIIVRYLHIKRFKFFNATMHNIFDDIENGLQAFSRYLGHACNVMREFSVFNYLKKPTDNTPNILKKHIHDIECKIDGINGLFVSVIELDTKNDALPYNFDFTLPIDYVYEIPYDEVESSTEFISYGNIVSIPIDYVKSVKLTREELYD